jgi:hypothetical protein
MKNATTATESLLVLQTLQHPHTIINNMKMPHQTRIPVTYNEVFSQLCDRFPQLPHETLHIWALDIFYNKLSKLGMTLINDKPQLDWKVLQTSSKILSLCKSRNLSDLGLNNFYPSDDINYCCIKGIADFLLKTIGSLEKLENTAREPKIVEYSFFADINTNKINWDENGINNHYGFCFEFTNQYFFACPLVQAANWECYFKQFGSLFLN